MSASVTTVPAAGRASVAHLYTPARPASRVLVVASLALILLAGFGLRTYQLSAEGLSEDELNKLHAVADYRAHGLTAANGEHPFLMKALLTVSVIAAETWNATPLAQAHAQLHMAEETALRLPATIFGTLTVLLLFLLVNELFGAQTALIAAALWALDPAAIGFNRIAKEDTFLLFFFVLANIFWLRGQRVAEAGARSPLPYYWATAAAFGAMLASKYLPYLLAISVCYYHIFQGIPATRWRMGKQRFLVFFAVMGLAFLICNPTILLPGTWHEMRVFAGEHRIGHDSYEFMGRLYRNQVTRWLRGVPWYFYFVFMAFKLPLATVAVFLVGLPLLLRRKLGDGRYFVFFWFFYWFFPFSLLGGKFLRYFTVGLPVVLIIAALGVQFAGRWLAQQTQRFGAGAWAQSYVHAALVSIVIGGSVYASTSTLPYYRLYTNALGGGHARAGTYFPHDEFYDAGVRATAYTVAAMAGPRARVACETPELFAHYAAAAGRTDIVAVSLSDRAALRELTRGDIVIVTRGRRYFSNDALAARLAQISTPVASQSVGDVPATKVYLLDETGLTALRELSQP